MEGYVLLKKKIMPFGSRVRENVMYEIWRYIITLKRRHNMSTFAGKVLFIKRIMWSNATFLTITSYNHDTKKLNHMSACDHVAKHLVRWIMRFQNMPWKVTPTCELILWAKADSQDVGLMPKAIWSTSSHSTWNQELLNLECVQENMLGEKRDRESLDRPGKWNRGRCRGRCVQQWAWASFGRRHR